MKLLLSIFLLSFPAIQYCMEQNESHQKGYEFALGAIQAFEEKFNKTAVGNVFNNNELSKALEEIVDQFTKELSSSAKDGIKGTGQTVGKFFSETFNNLIGNLLGEIDWQIKSKFSRPEDIFWNTPKYFISISSDAVYRNLFTKSGLYIACGIAPIVCVLYAYRYAIFKLKDPDITIKTSIESRWYRYIKWILRIKPSYNDTPLNNMTLSPELRKLFEEIINIERSGNEINDVLSNIMLVGKPGNGKTAVAEALAKSLGMDYIILTGSSFFQKNAEIKALDKVFKSMTDGRRVLIFIDEIDALLAKRSEKNSDSDSYRLLAQLLNHTSRPSKNFMLIGATNCPEKLDQAFYRRFQYVIEMPSPQYNDRINFFKTNIPKIIVPDAHNKKQKIPLTSLFTIDVNDIAIKTDGLSYAELQTIIDHTRKKFHFLGKNFTLQDLNAIIEQVKTKELLFQKVFLKNT